MVKKPTLTIPGAAKPKPKELQTPEAIKPYLATFIDADDGVSGVKIIPGHVESFCQYGDLTRLEMVSGKVWYIATSAAIVDALIKSWYLREEVEITNTVHPGSL